MTHSNSKLRCTSGLRCCTATGKVEAAAAAVNAAAASAPPPALAEVGPLGAPIVAGYCADSGSAAAAAPGAIVRVPRVWRRVGVASSCVCRVTAVASSGGGGLEQDKLRDRVAGLWQCFCTRRLLVSRRVRAVCGAYRHRISLRLAGSASPASRRSIRTRLLCEAGGRFSPSKCYRHVPADWSLPHAPGAHRCSRRDVLYRRPNYKPHAVYSDSCDPSVAPRCRRPGLASRGTSSLRRSQGYKLHPRELCPTLRHSRS